MLSCTGMGSSLNGDTRETSPITEGCAKSFNWGSNVTLNLHDNPTLERKSLYVRTAYRNEPDFSVSDITSPAEPASLFQGRRLMILI